MPIYIKEADGWKPLANPGELPGIGGWADITEVTGTGTKYEYTDNGEDWSAFKWYADLTVSVNTVTTTKGLVDSLVVGGGQRASVDASGGSIDGGLHDFVAATHDLKIASWQQANGSGDSTYIETNGEVTVVSPGGAGAYNRGAGALTPGQIPTPVMSSITGESVAYGAGASATVGGVFHTGSGFAAYKEETGGAVIIRVPRTSDKTGLPAGPFDTTTLRQKAMEFIEDRNPTVLKEAGN